MKHPLRWVASIASLVALTVVFVAPFTFIFLTAGMDRTQAMNLELALPRNPQYLQNLIDVFTGATSCWSWRSSTRPS